jgi:hypothetical protein
MDAYLATKVHDPKSALAAVMNLTLKHTADVLTMFVDIIAEKYGIDAEEMMDAVSADERFTGLVVDPLLHAAAPEDEPSTVPAIPVEAVAAAAAASAKRRGPKKLSEMTAEERAAHDAKVAARQATRLAAAVVAAAEPEPVAAEPEPAAAEPKVMKTFKIKPKGSAAAAQPSLAGGGPGTTTS